MLVCPECGRTYPAGRACTEDGAALVDTSGDPLLGQLVGPYRVACQIGAGGMGQVYKAVHPSIGSRVAIKVLGGDWTRHSSLVERFFAEARAVNLIRHEHIVNVLDLAWLSDGRPYIVMEYLDGLPLSAIIRRRGRLPLGSLVVVAKEVAEALALAHDKGIVHRDLKPDNIFVTPAGHAKLLDFGVAKLRIDDASPMHAATATGAILGTPYYMSPEQALGRHVDHRADIYALGVVLYEGVTGQRPFGGDSLFDILKQQIETPPPAPQGLRSDLPPELAEIIEHALAKQPDHRFSSARELANALARVAERLPRESFASLGDPSPGMAPATSSHSFASFATSMPGSSAVTPGSPYTAPSLGTTTALRQPRQLLWLGLGIASLQLLAVVALGGGALLWRNRPTPGPAASVAPTDFPRRGQTSKPPSTSSVAESRQQKPAGFDPRRVVVWEHFLAAEKRARETFPDATLLRIDTYGVNREGIVNTTVHGDFPSSVLFRWRSPAAATRPANLPEGARNDAKCLYYYTVDEDGVSSYVTNEIGLDEPYVPRPKCTIQQVWSKAEALGAPRGNYIGNIAYYAFGKSSARWLVGIGSFSQFVNDDCPSGGSEPTPAPARPVSRPRADTGS
jgi:serine/threonine-protein kinase